MAKKRMSIKAKRNLNKDFGKMAGNPKIGSTLRIRLPNDFKVQPSPFIRNLTNYDPDKTENLKKWCVEQAQLVYKMDENGNRVQANLIQTAQKIYDWVTK